LQILGYTLNGFQKGKTMLLKKLNPAVSKYWLIALAGLMWSASWNNALTSFISG